tara:strand:- start:218 stop:448 length:231 start_codon:yes stop_codon:yes gene_type:complete
MSYNVDDIDKILSFTSWSKKRKIDALFEIDADLYCNQGKDSTKTELDTTHKQSRKIYKAVKSLDEYWGGMMLREIK